MLALLLTAVVALIHLAIAVVEMALWTHPLGRRVFGTTEEFARASRTLASNQGLYNGFLAAGLTWGLLLGSAGDPIKIFFLFCVAVAGLFGAATVKVNILFLQTLPAALALLSLWLGW